MSEIIQWLQGNWQNLLKASGAVMGLGAILSFSLKRWIKASQIKALGDKVQKFSYYCGRISTLGLAKWKYTKPFWNNILEGYVILILKEVLSRMIIGLIKGLESDNKSLKDG